MPLRRSGRLRAEPSWSQHRWADAHLPGPRAGSDGRRRPMRSRACTLCPSYAALFVPPATLFLPTPARSTQSATLFARNAALSPPRATLFVPRAVRFPPRAARRASHAAKKVPTSTLFVPRAGHFARRPGHFAALPGLFVRHARCFARRLSRCVWRVGRRRHRGCPPEERGTGSLPTDSGSRFLTSESVIELSFFSVYDAPWQVHLPPPTISSQ